MGGNVFADVTPFDHSEVGAIEKQINKVVSKTGVKSIPIGSTATPTPGKQSGDMDMIVDQDALGNYFKQTDPKIIRKDLRAMFDVAGYQTAQSGVTVHVRIPLKDTAHQVDIMVVPNAQAVARFHTHTIPQGSPYKGLNKQLAMAYLAKNKNMLWSAFQGLYKRDANGKKGEFVTSDLDEIAKILIGPNAKAQDLGSYEQIKDALPAETAQQMDQDLKVDKSWKEFGQKESVELTRIKQLSGLL